jgi:hypothetical protein
MRDEGNYEHMAAEELRQIRVMAIVNCDLCDDDGYRGNRVCDHREHSSTAARERAKALVEDTLKRNHADRDAKRAQREAQRQESLSGGES